MKINPSYQSNQGKECYSPSSLDNLTTLSEDHSVRRNIICQITCVPLYMARNPNPHVTHLCRYFVLTHPGKDSSSDVDILCFIPWCVHPRSTNITDPLSSLNYFPFENYCHHVTSAITLQIFLHSSPYNVIR